MTAQWNGVARRSGVAKTLVVSLGMGLSSWACGGSDAPKKPSPTAGTPTRDTPTPDTPAPDTPTPDTSTTDAPACPELTLGTPAEGWPSPLAITADESGVLDSTLYAFFGEVAVTGAFKPKPGIDFAQCMSKHPAECKDPEGCPCVAPVKDIWTRAYAAKTGDDTIQQMIPGPKYVFSPGDLLKIKFVNWLAPTCSPDIEKYDKEVNVNLDTDEILTHHISHEINVPHNPNNTNLHVHGLHVDPNRDDVTIVITPVGEDGKYVVDDTDLSVSDQSIKFGEWQYAYRIPDDHLPGTYWYHPHKHGSTSVHVENGMAGPMVITPKDRSDRLSPNLPDVDDRVMVIQEIYNYGIQQGSAKGHQHFAIEDKDSGGAAAGSSAKPFSPADQQPDITINGVHQPTLELDASQLQRWRFINAGANHRSFSYVWLGKKEASPPSECGSAGVAYSSVPMTMVANDGITRYPAQTITANQPVLLGPGNRADVFVDLPQGEYALFKNWPAKVAGKDACFLQGGAKVIPVDHTYISDPYGLQPSGTKHATWDDYKVTFDGTDKTSIVPVIKGSTDKNLIEVARNFDIAEPDSRWQKVIVGGGGGKVDNQLLARVKVSATAHKYCDQPPCADKPQIPTDEILAAHSPTGKKMAKTPAYVAPIKDSDVVQSRAVVFDMSRVYVEVYKTKAQKKAQQNVKQFSLNGRVFALNDSIGGPNAEALVQKKATDLEALPPRLKVLAQDNSEYFTNPGYYYPVVADGSGYKWDTSTGAPPSLQDVTGLPGLSLVNTTAPSLPKNTQGMPVAGTAEEWLLINNSDIGHPFHHHINPFFITEIGQLLYDETTNKWSTSTLKPGDTMGWMLNSWWDTIIIPPHGFIKVRMWVNVPLQMANDATLEDNVNRSGSWVYHCHILRHEDRGMMMLVQTQQKRSFDLNGAWLDPDGNEATIADAGSGGLTFTSDSTPPWWSTGTGTWSPKQPLSGTQQLSNDAGETQTLDFCATADGQRIAFGNGVVWAKTRPSVPQASAPIDLSGTWSATTTDPKQPPAEVTVKQVSKKGKIKLKATPKGTSSTWWSKATGHWGGGEGDPLKTQPFVGTIELEQIDTELSPGKGSIETLTMCVVRDGKSIVLSNGTTWTKK